MIHQASSRKGPTTSTAEICTFRMSLVKVVEGAKQASRDQETLPHLPDLVARYPRILIAVVALVVMLEVLILLLALNKPLRAAVLVEVRDWDWDFWVGVEDEAFASRPTTRQSHSSIRWILPWDVLPEAPRSALCWSSCTFIVSKIAAQVSVVPECFLHFDTAVISTRS